MFKVQIAVCAIVLVGHCVCAASKIEFWDQQRRGANCFNANLDEQWFADAQAAGIRFVRLTFSKWQGAGRDFLIGSADDFKHMPRADVEKLRAALDWAAKHEIKLVIVPLSLPGARWRQNNQKLDPRLWQDLRYHDQSAAFWRELAAGIGAHPAVVGFELLNEPAAERALGLKDEWTDDLDEFDRRVKGTAADINVLYRRIVSAIRQVDHQTPVVLSCGYFGFAGSMRLLQPLNDPAVIYSFHTYEPYALTNWRTNAKRFSYPGPVQICEEAMNWDRQQIAWHVSRVSDWARANRIPANRIIVGEFGCDRRVEGVTQYMKDSIDVFNERGWHWAFYGFREDEWDAMDYELGTRPLDWKY